MHTDRSLRMGGAGSCLRNDGDKGTHTQTAGYGRVSGTKMTSQQLEVLKESVHDLGDIKDGALNVGILTFKGLFIVMPDTFPIFEFEEEDW